MKVAAQGFRQRELLGLLICNGPRTARELAEEAGLVVGSVARRLHDLRRKELVQVKVLKVPSIGGGVIKTNEHSITELGVTVYYAPRQQSRSHKHGRCEALTRDQRRCHQGAREGSAYCGNHADRL